MKHTLAYTLLAALLLGAAGLAQEPGEDDQPVRLRKKKRTNPPSAEPGKDKGGIKNEDRTPPDKEKPPPEKGKEKEPGARDREPIVPEDGGPADSGDEDKEVLDRIGKNMRAVEEKLGNAELTEGTRQTQDDILKDLDALLNRSQPPPQGGGGGNDQQPPPSGGEKGGSRAQNKGGGGGGMSRTGRGGSRQQQAARKRGGSRATADRRGGNQPQGGTGAGQGNTGGAGKTSPPRPKDFDPTRHLGEWGKIQESLRAGATTFADPKNVPPRYADALKQYYRTLSETGARKGE